jgi:hypothetical protein
MDLVGTFALASMNAFGGGTARPSARQPTLLLDGKLGVLRRGYFLAWSSSAAAARKRRDRRRGFRSWMAGVKVRRRQTEMSAGGAFVQRRHRSCLTRARSGNRDRPRRYRCGCGRS